MNNNIHPTPNRKMLHIENLYKSFQNDPIITDLSLHVKQHECIHIIGHNGCGKSTLLKIIAGILREDRGSIHLEKGIKIGALIENPGFIENESLYYNFKFLFSLTHYKDESKMKSYCERLGLDIHNKKAIKKYSLGMRQKAGIIQALMEDQNLILLDEPTRGLDDDALKAFDHIIKKLLEEKKSIIIASHEKHPSLHVNSVYKMEHGKLIQI